MALSAGLGEKPSSQLVYGPGPLVSGFPALHNLSIRAKSVISPSLETVKCPALFRIVERRNVNVTASGGLELSRRGGAAHRPFLLS